MNEIENSISGKCAEGFQPLDFTEEEKSYIKAHHPALDWLFYWFESNSSDGCWTSDNYQFMRSFYHHATA